MTWAKALRTLLSLEPLNASPSQVLVPFGESRVVKIGGASKGQINFALSPSGVVSATVDQDSRQITLDALVPGAGEMQIVVDGDSITVPFYVKKYAGRVQNAFLALTGNGPGRDALRDLARDAVERNLQLEPGATDKIDDSFQVPWAIPSQGATINVPVTLQGPALIPVKSTASVKLVKEIVDRDEPNLLFYSNNPEMLRKYYGALYTQEIKTNQAVRVLYHHQSAMSAAVRFSFLIKNGDTPARLQIIDGAASPQIDTFQIGHRAAAKFFPKWLTDSGYVQDLDPGETITLQDQILTHDMTTSGIYHFVLLRGDHVTVQLRADPPDVTPEVKPASLNPEVYPSPRKIINETYSVGGRWGFVSFGRQPILNHDSSHPLDGNYGVIYDMTIDLKNPTDQSNSADVVFDPAAGVARGVFIVDGKMVETTALRPPQEFLLGNYPLKPGEERKVHILTMPLAGSNYPARFAVRPRQAIARNVADK
jgi:hypothetical protein